MPLTSLINVQLVLTGPVRPRSMRERAEIARVLRARRATRVPAGVPSPAAGDMDALQAGLGSEEGQAAVNDIPSFATGGVTIFFAEID